MSRMMRWAVLGSVVVGSVASSLSAGPFDFLKIKQARKQAASPAIVTASGKPGMKHVVPVSLTSGPCYTGDCATWGGDNCYDQGCDCCQPGCCESLRVSALRRCRKCCDQSYYPNCPPYCAPNWGYYPTCWRRMPECWQCPKETMQFVPAAAPAVEVPPQAPPVPDSAGSNNLPE